MEARYAIGKSAAFFLGGLLAVAIDTALYLWGPYHYPVLAVAGALALLVGLRGVDRRIKLRIAPEGLWYSPWGHQPIAWGELERCSVFSVGKFRYIEILPKYPEQLLTRLPFVARINSSVNARFGKPSFYINPTQFDASEAAILSALERHLRSTA